MPASMKTMPIYDQYLTTYRSRENKKDSGGRISKRSARNATHDPEELKNLYNAIQWKNRFTPIYLTEPSPRSVAYAVHLKESANDLKQTINSLSGDDNELFSMKSAYSDNEELASVEFEPEDAGSEVPPDFILEVENFATPQINTSKYMKANAPVKLAPDSYSFDILTNKLHYELQFNIHEDETHIELQRKIARLINNSDIGLSAKVLETRGLSALEVTSDAYGLPLQSNRHFTIADDNTTYRDGVVDYLGLNKTIKEATNAVYSINGNEESSYSNSFDVYGAYHVTLHPENSSAGLNVSDSITARAAAASERKTASAKIGLYPDSKSLSNNIEAFVEGYNNFMNGVINNESEEKLTRLLAKDIHKFLGMYSFNLEKYGIVINDDATLDYQKMEEITDADAIKGFGSQILRKLNAISLDPMEYIDRRICAYPNPNATYPNPYMTSIYTGMLFSTWT